jgi:phage baseplate assembly protein W
VTRLAFPFGPGADRRSAGLAYGSDAHVRQMLELLILTMTGERVMRPDFGSPVKQMLFGAGNGPVAIGLAATLEATITQQLGDVLALEKLDVDFEEAEAVLEIVVTYSVLATGTADQLPVRTGVA